MRPIVYHQPRARRASSPVNHARFVVRWCKDALKVFALGCSLGAVFLVFLSLADAAPRVYDSLAQLLEGLNLGGDGGGGGSITRTLSGIGRRRAAQGCEVFTFYDRLDDKSAAEIPLLALWKKTWRDRGWDPVAGEGGGIHHSATSSQHYSSPRRWCPLCAYIP